MTRLSALLVLVCAQSLIAADRPNIVWLVSEDNSVHYLDLYTEGGAPTPRIAELAKHGLLFEHASSNAPVCSVARTTLATGCYGPRIGTQFHRKSVTVPMPDGLKMFPAYLRDAGYYTANNRKKDYNAVEGPAGPRHPKGPGVWDESSGKATWRHREDGQPFFYMESFPVCHESSLHFNQKSMQNDKTKTDPKTVPVAPYHPDTPTFRYTNARYRDNIMKVDQQIGAVVDRLKQDGVLDDTFIFYFGDHGGVLPRGKGYAYESGLHVPLVIYVPKNFQHLADAEMGSRLDSFVSFIDFGPTTLHLAGVDVPEQVDGRPFLGKDIDPKQFNPRNEAFGYADRFDEKWDFVRTLRVGKYEYVRSYQPFNFDGLQNNYRYKMLAYQEWRELFEAGKLNEVQSQFFRQRPAEALYDISKDPHETVNLANDPAHQEVAARMRNRLTEIVKSLPDLSFYPESELAKEAFKNPVAFGQSHKAEIAALVDVADLSLESFEAAEDRIRQALGSKNPWERYWGLIVCSSFGDAAEPCKTKAIAILIADEEPLVRIRAAEFLTMIGEVDPAPVFMDVLEKSKSGIEVGLVLNSLVLLQDGYDCEFDLSRELFQPGVLKEDTVKRRLEYLLSP